MKNFKITSINSITLALENGNTTSIKDINFTLGESKVPVRFSGKSEVTNTPINGYISIGPTHGEIGCILLDEENEKLVKARI